MLSKQPLVESKMKNIFDCHETLNRKSEAIQQTKGMVGFVGF